MRLQTNEWQLERSECVHLAATFPAQILSELPPHENIIRCFGFSIDAPQRSGGSGMVKLLLELCNGHLLDFQDSKGGKLSPKDMGTPSEMMDPFVQVAEAVRHLHAQRPPIQHRDLKVENILQGSDGNWKLCDFGSCSTACVPGHELPRGELQRLQEEIDKTVTMLYRPPEMADVQLNYRKGYTITEQVDIWMLGCILYTLAFYRHPFQDNATPMAIWNAKYFIPSEHPMARSAKLCALIHWLLAADPKDRPTAPRVLEACKAIGKSEYDEFVGQMPASVRERILQHDRIYGARSTKEPPKEWDLKNLQSAAAAVAASHSSGHSNGKVRENPGGFDVRFALSPETNGSAGYAQSSQRGQRQAAANPPSLQEDLLSLDAGSHQPGLHQAASTPALDDLIALGPATPSRAKSAPAVAMPEAGAGQNLLAFADFSSMPQQAQPMPTASTAGPATERNQFGSPS
ncbi:Gak [Symbiodinium sp. CCMP2592]|nr:Gak [Symbiodinium sp. CCMP2592]